jgi:hypothetical protein
MVTMLPLRKLCEAEVLIVATPPASRKKLAESFCVNTVGVATGTCVGRGSPRS